VAASDADMLSAGKRESTEVNCLMFVPCILRHSWNNQHYALTFTTHLFYIQSPTCFGSSLRSSGSFMDLSELLEIQSNRWYIIYEGWSKSFQTDAVKIIKLTIRPIGRRHPRSCSLPNVETGPTVSCIFATLPGSPFLSLTGIIKYVWVYKQWVGL
jgi:hypothetical protein